MKLSVRQKTNIRHFVYYLVNGTLDFELIEKTFGDNYHDNLKSSPELFYNTACVYINQEIKLSPNWPDTKKLGEFICQLHKDKLETNYFEKWETVFDAEKPDYSSDFKNFTKWFIDSKTVSGIEYGDYVGNGASFVEQCFAIWSNVVILDNNQVINTNHAIERVEQYIKSYFIQGYIDNLEQWECELHMQ